MAKNKKFNSYEIALTTIHEMRSKCDRRLKCSAHCCEEVMDEYKRRLAKENNNEIYNS